MTNPAWLLLGTSGFKWIPPPIAFVRRISKLYSSSGSTLKVDKLFHAGMHWIVPCGILLGSGTLAGPWVAGLPVARRSKGSMDAWKPRRRRTQPEEIGGSTLPNNLRIIYQIGSYQMGHILSILVLKYLGLPGHFRDFSPRSYS